VALVVLLAAPMLVSLASRIREGLQRRWVLSRSVRWCSPFWRVVGWVVVMTFDSGDTLGTFLRKDTVEHFIGAFTWYLPALGLAAGIWRGIDLV
jgi:hypothetical protein